jgi:hypothetical protein
MYRSIVTDEIYGSFAEQRNFFSNLNKALELKKPLTRLSKVQEILKQITNCDLEFKPKAIGYVRRLMSAKLDVGVLQRIEAASIGPKQQVDHDIIRDLGLLKDAVVAVRNDLKGKKPGQHGELYLLIEQLADMYEVCLGKRPPRTVNAYEDDGDQEKQKNRSKAKSPFFKIVKAVVPAIYFANKYPKTDSAIFEGIRRLK